MNKGINKENMEDVYHIVSQVYVNEYANIYTTFKMRTYHLQHEWI